MLWRGLSSCANALWCSMNFGFLNNLPQFRFRGFRFQSNTDSEPEPKSVITKSESSKTVLYDAKLWERPLQSIVSWAASLKNNISPMSTELQEYTGAYRRVESGCSLPLFRPYVAKVPWHKGARAFLSQLFPRYGHYCGPNWSSGKDNGLLLWDRRPIDWLDFCCYCHDIGYDTHDQAKLLKADLAFLECLEKSWTSNTKGDARIAYLYRSMCITGLRNILIPYRMHLVRLQSGPSMVERLGNLNGKNNTCRAETNLNNRS